MHKAIRQGDEFYCRACGLRWDIREEAPIACTPAQPSQADKPTAEDFDALWETLKDGS